ncbi:hypothetical protein LCGC14_0937780 [marine sediment metagenome]|uniref:Archaeosine synthase n=1 Tax=marine sediment metagenome TaxID=412755 RepID=A0A0F9R4K9_9ZZZZ
MCKTLHISSLLVIEFIILIKVLFNRVILFIENMKYIFEVLSSQIGYSRVGRILFSKERKLYISTPNIIIPIKNSLMKQLNFIQEFEDHDLFTISKDIFLKIGFIKEKFKNTGFIFTSNGTFEKFQETLKENLNTFSGDNIISIIPFNIPTTSINKEFAAKNINQYLLNVEKILKIYSDLNFGLSIKIFKYPELINLYIPFIKENKNIKILNLVDIFDNFNNFRNILRIISKIKKDLDNNIILMASGRITPKFYPILVYLGIDLINSSYLLYLSAEYLYETIEHLIPIYKIKYLPCSCVACKGNLKKLNDNKQSPEKFDYLCLHNLITATNYMNKIKQYLTYEDYRAFAEKSSFDDMNLISTLKILDKEYFNHIRYETPIMQKSKKIKCLGPNSYYRPDFREFRERTVKNFEPEPWTTMIILLPCSARKPYSESKSHKLFYSIIREFPEFPSFQEFIITSPLGVIPRQLENIYPVNSYDISVTGEWDDEEINITTDMLITLIKKYNNEIPIICHLKEEYLKIVKRASAELNHKFYFCEIHGKTTSDESLRSLRGLIKNLKDFYAPKKEIGESKYLSRSWIRKFTKILDYQFGNGSGRKIISNGLKPTRIKAYKQNNLIDLKTNQKLGVFNYSTGQINLTIRSFNRLIQAPLNTNTNFIVFNGENIQGNTLFRTGVLDYSPDLIPNNQVIIFDKTKNNIIGIGNLIVGVNFLKNSLTGRVVKITEKNKI